MVRVINAGVDFIQHFRKALGRQTIRLEVPSQNAVLRLEADETEPPSKGKIDQSD